MKFTTPAIIIAALQGVIATPQAGAGAGEAQTCGARPAACTEQGESRQRCDDRPGVEDRRWCLCQTTQFFNQASECSYSKPELNARGKEAWSQFYYDLKYYYCETKAPGYDGEFPQAYEKHNYIWQWRIDNGPAWAH